MATGLRILALFAGGGVALALCDQIHVQAGVLDYETGGFFGQAWWVPLQFGVASLAIVAGARPFARGWPAPRPSELVAGAAWFVAAYAASGVFDDRPGWLAAALVATWAARMARAQRPLGLVGWSLLLAAAGTGAEALLSAAGTFSYAHPDLLGVPVWLPGLYLHGAPLALGLARALEARTDVGRPAATVPAT
jgi:hypothetical protein